MYLIEGYDGSVWINLIEVYDKIEDTMTVFSVKYPIETCVIGSARIDKN